MEQTFVMIKPDGVKRGLTGEVIKRFERSGLKLVGIKMLEPSLELLHSHYKTTEEDTILRLGGKTLATYEKYGRDAKADFGTNDPKDLGKMVVEWLVKYMTSGPVVAMVLEGRHAVDNVISLVGPTMPVSAPGGTIRGDYSTDSAAYANIERRGVMNIAHASGSVEEAKFEVALWFDPAELHNYKRIEEHLVED